MSRLSPVERLQFGRRFVDLAREGVSVADIAQRFSVSRFTVTRCMLAVEVPEAKESLERFGPSLLDPEFVAMLHRVRDEIKAADARAIEMESRAGRLRG